MGIDDIIQERAAMPETPARTVSEQQRRPSNRPPANRRSKPQPSQQSTAPSMSMSNGSLSLSIPDPRSGTVQATMFWLNVIQTAALLYLLFIE